jgi:hypothetical protein
VTCTLGAMAPKAQVTNGRSSRVLRLAERGQRVARLVGVAGAEPVAVGATVVVLSPAID